MKLLRPLAALLVVIGSFTFVGCTSRAEDSSIPWSRPAGWEGQIPGMGTTPGSGAR